MSIPQIFNIAIFEPLYNALVFITAHLPGYNIGFAIIFLTLLVRVLILPLSHKSIKTQAKVRILDSKIKQIREKHKNSQQEQAAEIMKLYKEHGVNPFSGCLLTIIQIPIIFGLYWVFWKGLSQNIINTELLYSFIIPPENINFNFLGIFDLTQSHNIFLALLAGLSQYFQMKLAFPKVEVKQKEGATINFSDELKKNMAIQARYVLPIVIGMVSWGFPGAVPLYWVTSNIFSISHELLVRRSAGHLSHANSPQT